MIKKEKPRAAESEKSLMRKNLMPQGQLQHKTSFKPDSVSMSGLGSFLPLHFSSFLSRLLKSSGGQLFSGPVTKPLSRHVRATVHKRSQLPRPHAADRDGTHSIPVSWPPGPSPVLS